MLCNTNTQYGSVAKFFHWVIALLIVGMITFGYFLDSIPKEYQGLTYNLHKLTGLLLLSLMLLRGLWKLLNPKPMLPIVMPVWQQSLARTTHFLLYMVVIAMPLAGWIGSSAGGRPPHLGDLKLAFPVAPSDFLADFCFQWHNTLAIWLIVLVSIHVLAALYHHFILKDNVLMRMLPYSRE